MVSPAREPHELCSSYKGGALMLDSIQKIHN